MSSTRRLSAKALVPRKTPRQARSAVTVEAIHDATIQVLLKLGFERLTTTRVAERAGVSVGTLYQYYPNKNALLAAVLERHLGAVVSEVEEACRRVDGAPFAELARALVDALVTAKFREPEVSRALYLPAAQAGGAVIVRRLSQRAVKALAVALSRGSDGRWADVSTTSAVLVAALSASVQLALELPTRSNDLSVLRRHLEALAIGYLRAAQKVG